MYLEVFVEDERDVLSMKHLEEPSLFLCYVMFFLIHRRRKTITIILTTTSFILINIIIIIPYMRNTSSCLL